MISLLILAGSLYAAFTIDPKLGLDLRGGTQVVLETKDSPQVTANRESTDRAVEVLRRRVDALGVAEPSLTRAGDRRIIVELPGLQEPREAAEVLGRTAQLTFHEILGEDGSGQAGPATSAPADALALPDEDGIAQLQLAQAGLTGAGVSDAQANFDLASGGWFVEVDFNGSGEDLWKQMTGKAACAPVGDPARRIAIVLDGEVISSPAGGSLRRLPGRHRRRHHDDLRQLHRGRARRNSPS